MLEAYGYWKNIRHLDLIHVHVVMHCYSCNVCDILMADPFICGPFMVIRTMLIRNTTNYSVYLVCYGIKFTGS